MTFARIFVVFRQWPKAAVDSGLTVDRRLPSHAPAISNSPGYYTFNFGKSFGIEFTKTAKADYLANGRLFRTNYLGAVGLSGFES
jgi:hypothetical protein